MSQIEYENACVLLRKIMPRAMKRQSLLRETVMELYKLYSVRPFAETSTMDFCDFISVYAANAMA